MQQHFSPRMDPRPPSRGTPSRVAALSNSQKGVAVLGTKTVAVAPTMVDNGATKILPKLPDKEKKEDDLNFEKIINVFKHKMTKELYTRQAAMLSKIARVRKDGLFVTDMASVREILLLAFDVASQPGMVDFFAAPLSSLILLHATPLRVIPALVFQMRPNQQLLELIDTIHIIAREALTLGSEEVCVAFSQLVSSLCASSHVQGKMLSKLVTESEIPFRLMDWLKNHTDSLLTTETGILMLKSLRDISSIEACTSAIAQCGFFEKLSPALLSLEAQSDRLYICVEIIWNLLYDSAAAHRFSTEANFLLLSELLHKLLSDGYRTSDRDLRNDVLVLCCLLAKHENSRIHFARSPLLRLLLSYAAHVEGQSDSSAAHSTTAPPEDFEMKKQVWTIVSALPPEPFCTAQIVHANFLEGLFQYLELDPVKRHPSVSRWAPSQLLELHMCAVVAVPELAEHMQEQYTRLDGNERLLNVAVQSVAEKKATASENELYQELQLLALNALLKVCSSIDFGSEQQTQSTIQRLVDLFGTSAIDNPNAEAVRTNAACILQLFLESNEHNQRLFRKADGLKQCLAFLMADIKGRACKTAALRLSVWDLLWTVLQNSKNQLAFLVEDGLDLLLKLLLQSVPSQRQQLLGVLSDLLKNSVSHNLLHEWIADVPLHSDVSPDLLHWSTQIERIEKSASSTATPVNAITMLLSLWEVEEARLGPVVPAFTDTVRDTPALDSLLKLEETSSDDDGERDEGTRADGTRSMEPPPRASWSELRPDLRPSIYSCLITLGIESFSYASAAQITHLKVIAKYMTLRRAATFRGIVNTLDETRSPVIEHDYKFLTEYVNTGEAVKSSVRQIQEEFKNLMLEQEHQALTGFIKQVESRKNQKGIIKRAVRMNNSTSHLISKDDRERMIITSLDKQATLKRTMHAGDDIQEEPDVDGLDLKLEEKMSRDVSAQLGVSPGLFKPYASKLASTTPTRTFAPTDGGPEKKKDKPLHSVIEEDADSDYIRIQVLNDPVMDSLFGRRKSVSEAQPLPALLKAGANALQKDLQKETKGSLDSSKRQV